MILAPTQTAANVNKISPVCITLLLYAFPQGSSDVALYDLRGAVSPNALRSIASVRQPGSVGGSKFSRSAGASTEASGTGGSGVDC